MKIFSLILLILRKSVSALKKDFLNVASDHVHWFPEASTVGKWPHERISETIAIEYFTQITLYSIQQLLFKRIGTRDNN